MSVPTLHDKQQLCRGCLPDSPGAPATRQRTLTVWRGNRLVFGDVGMDELARRFHRVCGLRLVLRGEAFAGWQFTGELPVTDADKALLILSETFALKAVRDEDRSYFIAE